ncbi:hypothetical protein FACS189451_07660 [Bacteroidia bacterium]|nr:hypothetical protein FACS189451_07660 [Bacteroidia bacterium]
MKKITIRNENEVRWIDLEKLLAVTVSGGKEFNIKNKKALTDILSNVKAK